MTKPKLTEPLPALTRTTLKNRILRNLDQFPRELELGTFKTEELLIRLGHLLRELGDQLDKSKAESIIYGPDTGTLKELGDEYWELGVALSTHRPRNRRVTLHSDSITTIERTGL